MTHPCLTERKPLSSSVALEAAPSLLRNLLQQTRSEIKNSEGGKGFYFECHLNIAGGALADVMTIYRKFHRSNPEMFPPEVKKEISEHSKRIYPYILHTVSALPDLASARKLVDAVLLFAKNERDKNLPYFAKEACKAFIGASEDSGLTPGARLQYHRDAGEMLRYPAPADAEMKGLRRSLISSALRSSQERFNHDDSEGAQIFFNRSTSLMSQFGLSAEYRKIVSQFRATFAARDKEAAKVPAQAKNR